jgi:hypothetical protein
VSGGQGSSTRPGLEHCPQIVRSTLPDGYAARGTLRDYLPSCAETATVLHLVIRFRPFRPAVSDGLSDSPRGSSNSSFAEWSGGQI